MEEEKEAKWYAVKVHTVFDNVVKAAILQLRESLSLEDKILEVLIPVEKQVRIKNGKRQEKEERLFPGHILVHMVMCDETWNGINNIERVSGFLGPQGSAEPIPAEEIEGIKKRMESGAVQHDIEFRVGDVVRIVDGPFKRIEGRISEIDSGKRQVLVLVPMFGRDTPIRLDIFQIRNI